MDKRTHLIKPLLGMDYAVISHGKGIYLYDEDGNSFLDGCSGAVTANIGHGVSEITEAMVKQATQVSFVYRSQFTSSSAEELAERLVRSAPGDLDWVFFVNSGSEAMETALKIAVQYWQELGRPTKNRVISRWMSYHGITMGALSMSGHVIRRSRFNTMLEQYPTLSPPYCYRCTYRDHCPNCSKQYALEFEREVQRLGADTIAAFVCEPIIGAAGGAVVPPDNYFKEMKAVCDRYDILFIADEVMTGVGRTGKMYAMEHWGVVPDILALGKGMSAGYTPMAATLVSDRIIQTIERGSKIVLSGHTFSANPLSASICLAVLNYIESHNIIENAEKSGAVLLTGLEHLKSIYPIIGDVRGRGLLTAIELVQDSLTKESFPLQYEVTNRLIRKCYEAGLLVYTAAGGLNGVAGDAVIIAPPLVIQEHEVQTLLDKLNRGLTELVSELEAEGLYETRSIS
ncbi:aspartate aminotransferase family protein [Pseudalkalibacillus hwajinpoensis]|uniref:Aspartate aminotransferase family protein n=1 Tax=Guptibacillus hwajinpoensis TaxID=208199 RepID=A0A4U1MLN0_9BACL|nr:aspartate aminotransferase family protein [Pseudalkalibacillus hwajinpoensis]TKD71556.1 aspartate aminotransferase family protein [Pseudalkalibacillus hwajinpoensis]